MPLPPLSLDGWTNSCLMFGTLLATANVWFVTVRPAPRTHRERVTGHRLTHGFACLWFLFAGIAFSEMGVHMGGLFLPIGVLVLRMFRDPDEVRGANRSPQAKA